MKITNWFIHTLVMSANDISTCNKLYDTSVDMMQILVGQDVSSNILCNGEPRKTSLIIEIYDDYVITLNNRYDLGDPATDDDILYLKSRLGLW